MSMVHLQYGGLQELTQAKFILVKNILSLVCLVQSIS